MELGNILGKFKPGEKEAPQKFLALILTDEVVQAAIWHVVNEQTEMTALGIPVEWDGDTATTAELITAADATISSATEGMSDESSSVILGIPHTWTDKDGILGSKRDLIKNICHELELKPIGFVVITDSILSYLKIQEGTPTTSIMIQVSRDDITLLLVRLGRIEAIEIIGRSDDIVEDVIEGIARFKASDNLPSRIILFNGMHNLDEMMQNLLSVDWQAQFHFLHIPKIETLAKDVSIRALAVAGGGEVAKSLGFTLSDTPQKDIPIESPKKEEGEVPDVQEDTQEEVELISAAEMGFSMRALEEESIAPQTITEGEELKPKFVLPKLHVPHISLPRIQISFGGNRKLFWVIALLLMVLGLSIFWFSWILPTATINITVAPKPLEQAVTLTLSTTTTNIDVADAIVPAKLETTSVSGDKTEDTTGTKIIGDAAKGNITIYNRTTLTKTFNKGSVVAVGSLKFSLDGDVTVASGSAANDYVGKATTSITANDIGTASNIAAGTEFAVMSFGKDSYVGKNDVALGGGTSEEIRVVSKDDQKVLAKNLTDQLLATLTSTANSSNSPGSSVYLIASSAKLTSESYSAKVGEKATSLTGNVTLSASLLRYQTQDVTTLMNAVIDQSVPSGYMRSTLPATVDLSADTISDTGDTVKGTAKVQVALLPVVDVNTIQSSLTGLQAAKAATILQNQVPGFEQAGIVISPSWLPPRLKFLPHNPKNIKIIITPTTP